MKILEDLVTNTHVTPTRMSPMILTMHIPIAMFRTAVSEPQRKEIWKVAHTQGSPTSLVHHPLALPTFSILFNFRIFLPLRLLLHASPFSFGTHKGQASIKA